LGQVGARLGDAVVDPSLWPQIMDEISVAVGASGAVLLQSDGRTADVPRTAGVNDMIRHYFAAGWHMRDLRAQRGVPLLLRGEKVVIDQDIVTPEEMRRSQYYIEAVGAFGFQWFAALGFAAGPALWSLVIQRTRREGPFERADKQALAPLAQPLSEMATLSAAVGRAMLSNVTHALGLVDQPALTLDQQGFVLDCNAAAERIFDDEIKIKNRRLNLCGQWATAALTETMDRLRTTPDTAAMTAAPIVVQRAAKRPLVIRILPVPGAARSPFLGARALLVFSDLDSTSGPRPEVLSQTFRLSLAEARLASLLATGISLEQAADELGLAHETVRNQLKAVFVKTETHRQGELVALLSQL
jgi:DNA-binding CsgD family transcriptional regulator